MLKEIKLKNFKLHRDTKLNFGKITLFIGPNNSGKSSAIHAMQLLKKELIKKEERDQDASSMFIDVGSSSYVDNFARRGEKSFEIEISGTVPLKNFLSTSEIGVAESFIASDEIEVFSAFTPEHSWFLPKHRIGFLSYGFEIDGNKKTRIRAADDFEDKKIKKRKAIIEKGNDFGIFSNLTSPLNRFYTI